MGLFVELTGHGIIILLVLKKTYNAMENVKRRKRIKRLYEKVVFIKSANHASGNTKTHEEQ
jgi:hypothetical protein